MNGRYEHYYRPVPLQRLLVWIPPNRRINVPIIQDNICPQGAHASWLVRRGRSRWFCRPEIREQVSEENALHALHARDPKTV